MKPAWDKLMDSVNGEMDGALVGDVDCTGKGQPLCEANGVRGYPTIKWGDPANLEDYQGGRSFDDLKKFAEENLKPVCSPSNLDLCDDDKKAEIEALQAISAEDLDAKIEEKEEELKAAEKTFETEVEQLQKKYQQLSEEKDAALEAVKASGLGLMKAVKAAAKSAKDEL
jgi:hypothetical protein